MTKKICILLVFGSIIISALTVYGQESSEEPKDTAQIEWVNSFEDAQAKAIAENKLILLDFYSDT